MSQGQETEQQRENRLFVRSVGRSLDILEAFATEPRALSIAEIAKLAGVDKSAAQRLTHTLVARGYLERLDGGLVPGRSLLDRTCDYLRCNALIERATPLLMNLRRNVRERVDLSLFDDLTMQFVIRLQSKRETFYATLIGRRVPTFCSSGGRSMLASLPEDKARDILVRSPRRKFTPRTVNDDEGIWEKIREAQQLGYAIAVEELLPGEVAIGVAVMGRDSEPLGAIHVAGSLGEWRSADFAQRFGPLIVEASRALTPYET